MRVLSLAAVAAAALAAGCSLLPVDRFAGRYRVADPKDGARIEIIAADVGRWDMRYDRHDPDPSARLVAASRAELGRWFGQDVPLDSIRCLMTTGSQEHPVLCSVPKDMAIRLDRRAAPRVSRTGWILVAPKGHGLVFGDLVRER